MLDFYKICGKINQYPGVAQVVARLNGVQEAVSSSLATRTSIDNLLLRVVDFFIFRSLSFLLLLYIILIIGKNRVEVKKNDRTGYNTASQRVRRRS